MLIVNVASACGLTPQYAGLQQLQVELADQDFTVLGLPCNQFGAQEPGSESEIAEFCSTNYQVAFLWAARLRSTVKAGIRSTPGQPVSVMAFPETLNGTSRSS